MPDAAYRVSPAPRRPIDTELQVLAASFVPGVPNTSTVPLEGSELTFPQVDQPEDFEGSAVSVEVSLPAPSPGASAIHAEVRDLARDGHFTAKIDSTALACDATTCLGSIDLPIVPPPAATDGDPPPPISLQVRLVGSSGTASPWMDLAMDPALVPQPEAFRVRGRVVYNPRVVWLNEDEIDGTPSSDPQYRLTQTIITQILTPARNTRIWVGDACGAGRFTYTDELGRFDTIFASICGGGNVNPSSCQAEEPLVTPGCGYVRAYAKQKAKPLETTVAAAKWIGDGLDGPDDDVAVTVDEYKSNPTYWRMWVSERSGFVLSDGDSPVGNVNAGTIIVEQASDEPTVSVGGVTVDGFAQALMFVGAGADALVYLDAALPALSMPRIDIAFTPQEIEVWEGDPTSQTLVTKLGAAGAIRMDPKQYPNRWAMVHEVGHIFHNASTYWGSKPYTEFSEPMSHMLAIAVTGQRAIVTATNASRAENPEFNGSSKNGGDSFLDPEMIFYGSRIDPRFTQHFEAFETLNTSPLPPSAGSPPRTCAPLIDPSATDAENRALARKAYCCKQRRDGVDRYPETWQFVDRSRAKECFYVNADGYSWRILYDLLDAAEPEPPVPVSGVTDFDWDKFDGGLRPGEILPTEDVLVQVIERYIAPYVGLPMSSAYWTVDGEPWPLVDEDENDRGGVQTKLIDVVDGLVCMERLEQENSQVLFRDVMGWRYDYAFEAPQAGCP
jgi:hypothetical protein